MRELSQDQKILALDVFNEIAESSWFNRNAIPERELFILILEKHREGAAARLRDECTSAARLRFSRKGG